MTQLGTLGWDVLLLSETWREKKQERSRSRDGHLFCGSGGKKGEQGVAIVLNKRWAHGFRAFRAVSTRVCAIDVDIGIHKVRFVSIYMPHGGYDDDDVEEVYSQLDRLITSAEDSNRQCVLMGDWNAVVGQHQPGDKDGTVGAYGIGKRNGRATWLVQWASLQCLTIANTVIAKRLQRAAIGLLPNWCKSKLMAGGRESLRRYWRWPGPSHSQNLIGFSCY